MPKFHTTINRTNFRIQWTFYLHYFILIVSLNSTLHLIPQFFETPPKDVTLSSPTPTPCYEKGTNLQKNM